MLRAGAAIVLAVTISFAAYKTRSLSRSGMYAAALVGALHFALGGLVPAMLLIAFFLSSSLLSRLGGAPKRQVGAAFAKGGQRDAGQVLANGGLAALFAALYGLRAETFWLFGVAGALAASTADTWATELGVLSRRSPRRITDMQPVPRGTSGAISPLGLGASLAGAGLIAGLGALAGMGSLGPAAVIAGMSGSLLDSLLGASAQAIYFCPRCRRETERYPRHTCGTATRHIRGWKWLNNDGVNFAATAVGGLVAIGLWVAWDS